MAIVETDPRLRRTVLIVVALNLAYFGVEFTVAMLIGSVSLFADSIDFLEDAAVNLLIAVGLGWSAAERGRLGAVLALLILVPGIATLWTAWSKFLAPVPPEPVLLTVAGVGAMVVNGTCALLLARIRSDGGSLTRAAFLSARNDVIANAAIVLAGFATAATLSAWPDLVVGLAIALLNAGAAWEVWEAASEERRDAAP
jgi:Co/Zn/Cd efflux system component